MFTGGSSGLGAAKPTDYWSLAMLGNNWPEHASIASLEATVAAYRAAYAAALERVSVLESARDAVAVSMVGEAFEAMHERMMKLVNDRKSIADGIEKFVKYGDRLIDLCYETQKELAAECKKHADQAREYSDAGLEPLACAELVEGMLMCEKIAAEATAQAETWGAEMKAAMPVVTPASWGAPATPPGAASSQSGDPGIQATGFDPLKQAGGAEGQGPGRPDPTSSSESAQPNSGDPSTSKEDGGGKKGQADPNAHQGTDGQAGKPGTGSQVGHGTAEPAAKNSAATPAPSTGLGSLPSPSGAGGGGSGLGSSSGGLGGLSSVGMGGMKPPGLEGAGGPGGLGAPKPPMLSPPTGAGAGGGSGSGAGSGGGIPRIPPPSVPVTQVSTAPPVSPTPSAAASTSAGAFSANPAAVQPLSSASSAGGGVPVAAGAGPVGMAPVGGSSAVAPPPAQVGPAPTASPGLSQGALGPAGSAAAAAGGVSASAAGMGVVPASFTEDGPSKVSAHAQLAVNTVKSLIPGIAGYPGMAIAAAVVKVPGGIPQVVIATNEGTGYLPEGCFLPAGVIHAFVEMESPEFDLKWMGWVDPARTLIDYVVMSEQRGEPMDLLGLACSVAVSDEVKALFPQVVPKVAPDPGARPLGPEKGRNRHRLQVLAAPFYDQLRRVSEVVRDKVAVAATRAVMELDAAQPFSADTAPPMMLLRGHDLSAEQWSSLREDYEQRVRIVGTLRPGFLAGGRNDQLTGRYRDAFLQLRVMETILGWQGLPNIPVEDIVYAAHQAGVDVNELPLRS